MIDSRLDVNTFAIFFGTVTTEIEPFCTGTGQSAKPPMKRTCDQLPEETTDMNLAALLRSGAKLEIGEDPSIGSFARIRKENQTITVDATYRGFAAILKEMEASAKRLLDGTYEKLHQQKEPS